MMTPAREGGLLSYVSHGRDVVAVVLSGERLFPVPLRHLRAGPGAIRG